MATKNVSGECDNCESSFEMIYMEELVSEDSPQFCPFCGETIEELEEEIIDDEPLNDTEGWD